MSDVRRITVADLEALLDAEAPDFVEVLASFCAQPEPPAPEGAGDGHLDLRRLKSELGSARAAREKRQRQERAHEVWKRYLAQPGGVAPQIEAADLLVRAYEAGRSGPRRRVLLDVIARAPLIFGVWGGLKRIYKAAEADFDAPVIGAFAARVEGELLRPTGKADVSPATLRYLSRRVWRFLRQLGKASPELYPSFAVEVLRSYPEGASAEAGVGGRISRHLALKWGGMPRTEWSKAKFRAPFRDAWKRSPDPLLLLLETCRADGAARFAITGLQELFPAALRDPRPEWLARLCFRPLASAHELVVGTLEASADYHAARLKERGLHDAVMALLRSPSARARQYAIAYARTQTLTTEQLLELVDPARHQPDVVVFAAELLSGRPPRTVGLPVVVQLLGYPAARSWAQNALDHVFEPRELTHDILRSMLFGSAVSRWVRAFVKRRFPERALPASFWVGLLRHPELARAPADTRAWLLGALEEYPVRDVSADWLLEQLAGDDSGAIREWLEAADALPPELTSERLRGLVFDAHTRGVALDLLGRTQLFSVADVGVGWLLALVRRSDPALHDWARRYLLAHVRPEQIEGQAQKLFGMAMDAKEPEPARLFAQEYLLCHHPRIGQYQAATKEIGVQPGLSREVYTFDRVWPAVWDDRSDVRRFGATLVRAEFRRWGQLHRVYEIAESPNKEVRNVAYAAFGRSQSGEDEASSQPGDELALTAEELDPALVFSMTESTVGTTRDVAMALIREHYDRLGGAERLGWLMQSADRDVRLFAVRLLWEKHRPGHGRFDDRAALASLLRRMLFSVPPSRGGHKVAFRKRVPANVAKRRLVEVVRDFGLADREFAALVAPVLAEMTGSIARGEWQICLSALLSLRAAHGIEVEQVAG